MEKRACLFISNKYSHNFPSFVDWVGIFPTYNLCDNISNISYVSPQVVEACALERKKHAKAWLVQLAIGTKRKVAEMIESCTFEMSGLHAQATLNILPLGSCEILLGMEYEDK
jgi:hypothetical protein